MVAAQVKQSSPYILYIYKFSSSSWGIRRWMRYVLGLTQGLLPAGRTPQKKPPKEGANNRHWWFSDHNSERPPPIRRLWMQPTGVQPPMKNSSRDRRIYCRFCRTLWPKLAQDSVRFWSSRPYSINVINVKIDFFFHLMLPAALAGEQHEKKPS